MILLGITMTFTFCRHRGHVAAANSCIVPSCSVT